jgi:hypothetical protein
MMHPDITAQLVRDHRARALDAAEQHRRVPSRRVRRWRRKPIQVATVATVAPRPEGTTSCAPITVLPGTAA